MTPFGRPGSGLAIAASEADKESGLVAPRRPRPGTRNRGRRRADGGNWNGAIAPDEERFFAKRMKATTIELNAASSRPHRAAPERWMTSIGGSGACCHSSRMCSST
jgi:hypothetical protein